MINLGKTYDKLRIFPKIFCKLGPSLIQTERVCMWLRQTNIALETGVEDGELFVGLRSYLHRTVQACRRDGYVTTLSGRRRYLPAIKDTNVHARAHVCRCMGLVCHMNSKTNRLLVLLQCIDMKGLVGVCSHLLSVSVNERCRHSH